MIVVDTAEFARQQPVTPVMRACDELGTGFYTDLVEWNPHAADLAAVDAVIGLIVVPGRNLVGARFLDQDMFVKNTHAVGPHQVGGDFARRRLEHELAVLIDAVPVAVIPE